MLKTELWGVPLEPSPVIHLLPHNWTVTFQCIRNKINNKTKTWFIFETFHLYSISGVPPYLLHSQAFYKALFLLTHETDSLLPLLPSFPTESLWNTGVEGCLSTHQCISSLFCGVAPHLVYSKASGFPKARHALHNPDHSKLWTHPKHHLHLPSLPFFKYARCVPIPGLLLLFVLCVWSTVLECHLLLNFYLVFSKLKKNKNENKKKKNRKKKTPMYCSDYLLCFSFP